MGHKGTLGSIRKKERGKNCNLISDRQTDRQTDIRTSWAASSQLKKGMIPKVGSLLGSQGSQWKWFQYLNASGREGTFWPCDSDNWIKDLSLWFKIIAVRLILIIWKFISGIGPNPKLPKKLLTGTLFNRACKCLKPGTESVQEEDRAITSI